MALRAADLLVAGGAADPNLHVLASAAEAGGRSVIRLLHGGEADCAVAWDLESGTFRIDGEPISVRGAFVRYDVFSGEPPEGLDHAAAWYAAASGWAAAQPDVGFFNRGIDARTGNKVLMLFAAREHGFRTPRTLLSNHRGALEKFGPDAVAKPVAGGAYVRPLVDAMASADWAGDLTPLPALAQQRLCYPEHRVYRIGPDFHRFEVRSNLLDYRPGGTGGIRYAGPEAPWPGFLERLRGLTDALAVDFCACDFKSEEDGKEPLFLELNSGPMFAAFDAWSGGRLTGSMIEALAGAPRQRED